MHLKATAVFFPLTFYYEAFRTCKMIKRIIWWIFVYPSLLLIFKCPVFGQWDSFQVSNSFDMGWSVLNGLYHQYLDGYLLFWKIRGLDNIRTGAYWFFSQMETCNAFFISVFIVTWGHSDHNVFERFDRKLLVNKRCEKSVGSQKAQRFTGIRYLLSTYCGKDAGFAMGRIATWPKGVMAELLKEIVVKWYWEYQTIRTHRSRVEGCLPPEVEGERNGEILDKEYKVEIMSDE